MNKAKSKNCNWPKIAEEILAKFENPKKDDLKYLARDFARQHKIKPKWALIYLEKAFLKRNNKPEATKKNNELLDDAYTFAIQVLQRKGTEDIVNRQLDVFYQFESDGLTLEQSYEINHHAKEEFEQATKEEPEFKTSQELISKKETESSTSIEVHGESQDEIESRIYSVALNFLFNFQDPGKEILRSELIKTMNDYIEYFSLKYSAVQKLADKAISEFREKSRTTPKFKTAYQELYKTEEKILSKPDQSPDLKIEKKKSTVVKSVSGPKVKLNHDVKHQEKITLDDRDQKIIFQFSTAKVAAYVLNYLKIPKTTFYRRLNNLTDLGILVKLEENKFSRYIVSPRFKQSLEMGLVVGVQSSPKTQSPSKTAPFSKQKDLVQHSKSHSKSHFKEIPSDREKPREKHEIGSKTTRKIPPFEELVAKFDPHNIRSHDYLYICKIKRAPDNFRQQLAKSNWLESKEGMNNWTWYRGSLKLHNIQCHYHIYIKKVTIQLLEVSSPDPFANNAIADDIAVQLTAYLEDQYPGLVLYDVKRRSRLEVKKLHHAIPNHPIAIRAFELNYTSTGKRFGVDNSKGKKELEAHNHKCSTEDIDNYIEDCDFKAENDYWFRDSARDIQQNGRILHTTTKIQKKNAEIQQQMAKQIEEVTKNQLWSISGQRHQTEVYQSFINGSMHLIEQNLTLEKRVKTLEQEKNLDLEERVKTLEQQLPTSPKPGAFVKEREMFDPSFTLVKRLEHIVRKNPGISRGDLKHEFGWKLGSVGPTIGRLAKRVNLREEHRRLFISA